MSQRAAAIIALCLALLAPHGALAALAGIKSAILVDLSSGRTLYARNADAQIAPASLAKLMTMFIALDAVKAKKLSLSQKVPITAEAARTGGSAMRLAAGEKVPVVRLLAGMAVASGNDAAMALATRLADSPTKFAALMNAKAAKLGMTSTKFKNPTGLPAAGQKTTARDLALMCRAYLKAHPAAKRFHSMKFFMHKGAVARNTNPLLGTVPGVDGLKTGWTVASGYNLIITAQRGATRLLAIVLGGQSKAARDAAARELIEAGFKYFRSPAKLKQLLDGAGGGRAENPGLPLRGGRFIMPAYVLNGSAERGKADPAGEAWPHPGEPLRDGVPLPARSALIGWLQPSPTGGLTCLNP